MTMMNVNEELFYPLFGTDAEKDAFYDRLRAIRDAAVEERSKNTPWYLITDYVTPDGTYTYTVDGDYGVAYSIKRTA